eukprot:CAMPEP_0168341028 /NCGR_PEP_ID=MMETSP0213-20121227/14419_1 /TAXON_ID=151035 /ORGANISM="Euplotes harpa, Strain FSP1.4" /LENGTH=329 /DNA_ID=CAMNT_0008347385 /DNA_START=876 /DNA_END=1865 /DNA_ORIENTATION=-
MTIQNIGSKHPVIEFISGYNSSILNSVVTNCTSEESVLYATGSQFDLLQNLTISNIKPGVMDLHSSSITRMNSVVIRNAQKGLFLDKSEVALISNSTFYNLGSSSILKGGAIYSKSSSINVRNSTFYLNKAVDGGAVFIDCKTTDTCSNLIMDVAFTENVAVSSGGAIKYNVFRPKLTNVVFTLNKAEYGNNIASYPTKIVQAGSITNKVTINNVGSGIDFKSNLVFELQDYDSQRMVLDDTSQIKISPVTSSAKVTGIDSAKVVNGTAVFSSLVWMYKPGATNVLFEATSKSINTAIVRTALGSVSNNTISVSFRHCKPGEFKVDAYT